MLLLRQPGMEVQPSRRRPHEQRAHPRGAHGRFPQFIAAGPIDPLNGVAFANRVIPSTRFSPTGRPAEPLPLPNFNGPGGNYSINGVNRTETRELLVKFDYLVPRTPKSPIAGRTTNGTSGSLPGAASATCPAAARVRLPTTIATWRTLLATMLNSFSFSVTHNKIQGNPQLRLLKRSALGLTCPEIFANNSVPCRPP